MGNVTVKSRHVDVNGQRARVLDWQPADGPVPFEVRTLRNLRAHISEEFLTQLELAQFEFVIACTEGSGEHEVDFERAPLDPGHWVHIRPGQVHRWLLGDFEATLLLFAPRERSPHWRPGPRVLTMSEDARHDIAPLVDLLAHERRSDFGPSTLLLIRDLAVRWLELDLPDANEGDPIYTAFRRMLSREVIEERNVAYYARALNCSPRTLTRACERAGAASPKHLIDQSVLLEAKRLLALPNASITQTSDQLGFTEPTNFTKFFKRVGGISPSDWQADRTCSAKFAPDGFGPEAAGR